MSTNEYEMRWRKNRWRSTEMRDMMCPTDRRVRERKSERRRSSIELRRNSEARQREKSAQGTRNNNVK